MISVQIDFTNATPEEQAAFNAIPGMKEVLEALNVRGRQFNTVLNVIEDSDEAAPVREGLLELMRTSNAQIGHSLNGKAVQFQLVPTLNQKQKTLLLPAADQLAAQGIFEKRGADYLLTAAGYEFIYR
ncbi:hypothetical protein [Rugamonas rubra]|uniref:Uncharacterized protein n=1 Tax=Rugamonas rubra TaxID=758825 RepID=A0A1I4MJI8_9BURK|nr:hypothetical protein [Rugamonas rubra]SFM03235.1 hypothetical protein SAMN02982985_02431 [Rugamonas rubra]